MDLDYPILSDSNKKVAAAYGVLNKQRGFSSRVTFYIGADGKILAIDKNVKAAQDGANAAKKLKELGVAEK